MGYNKDLFADVRRQMEEGRLHALDIAQRRRQELYANIPEVYAIDLELSRTGLLIMEEISKGKVGLEERLENIRLDNLDLQARRESCLLRAGYPADYDLPPFACEKCKDTGYDGQKMCTCLRAALSREGMKRAGVGKLFETQRFDTFSLDYYRHDVRVYNMMKSYLEICQAYADGFTAENSGNLLLCGSTGLGKTHLSTSIAGIVVEKGFDVLYESAPNLLSAYEAERFGRGSGALVSDTSRYLTCDLLIIDDLGAEMTNSFTVGIIYNILNTRIVSRRPTIISTNLTPDEIRTRYTDRVASRLFGEFTLMRFEGKDIRMQKMGIL
jgi:DNA replication protein DnaC